MIKLLLLGGAPFTNSVVPTYTKLCNSLLQQGTPSYGCANDSNPIPVDQMVLRSKA
jgi:hypothetical protein